MPADRDPVQWLHHEYQVSIVELADTCGVSESIVRELVEYGALVPADAERWTFSSQCVARVRRAVRLGADLELETSGMALAMSFLERIEQLERELARLSAQVPAPAKRGS